MHVHETAQEVHDAVKTSGKRPLTRLAELNLISPRLVCVHTTSLIEEEMTMLAELGYRLSLPTVWCFMKRFCKAGGRQVATPDAFFHTISYFIELAMIQVCCPSANVLGILKE